MPTMDCRVSKLEAQREDSKDKLELFMEVFAEHCRKEAASDQERLEILLELRDKQAKMAGFLSGATMIITAIATVAGIVYHKLFGS